MQPVAERRELVGRKAVCSPQLFLAGTDDFWKAVLMSMGERFRDYLYDLGSSGQAWEFLRTHSAQLAGLTALIVLLLRALRPLRAWERSEYEKWKSQAATWSHRVALSAGHILAEQSALIAFVMWFWLALRILGFLAAPSGRIILYLLAALCAFRVGSALVGDLFAGEKAGGVLPLGHVTAGFYRRRLRLFLAYILVGILLLESAGLLSASGDDRILLRQVFGVGIFIWALGDMLVVDKQWGVVKAIHVRSTIFETFDGYVLIIPNSELLSSKILNWTHYGWGVNQITLKVGIGYDSDVRKATEVIYEVCRANPQVLKDPPPWVQFDSFAESSLAFVIQVHVATPAQRGSVTHDLNSAILEALRENGIEVPVPQRDLHVKSWPGAPEQRGIPVNLEI